MGPLLDLAVIALAVLVSGSLGLLAWTLGVSAVSAVRRERQRLTDARRDLAARELWLPEQRAAAEAVLVRLARALKGDR